MVVFSDEYIWWLNIYHEILWECSFVNKSDLMFSTTGRHTIKNRHFFRQGYGFTKVDKLEIRVQLISLRGKFRTSGFNKINPVTISNNKLPVSKLSSTRLPAKQFGSYKVSYYHRLISGFICDAGNFRLREGSINSMIKLPVGKLYSPKCRKAVDI